MLVWKMSNPNEFWTLWFRSVTFRFASDNNMGPVPQWICFLFAPGNATQCYFNPITRTHLGAATCSSNCSGMSLTSMMISAVSVGALGSFNVTWPLSFTYVIYDLPPNTRCQKEKDPISLFHSLLLFPPLWSQGQALKIPLVFSFFSFCHIILFHLALFRCPPSIIYRLVPAPC